ncbi:MAG: BPL-N domain-containing protein [Candidatus Eisenbacteria bacterium]
MIHAALIVLLSVALVACNRAAPTDGAAILLFTGEGTSPGDVAAIERVLGDNRLSFATATSSQLNRMSLSQLLAYRLIIVPGGNFIDMGAGLTPLATANVRDAVQHGVSYLGICAGAFLAGDGRGSYNSFDLTSGVRFGFYAAETRGLRKAAVTLLRIDAPPIDCYWEDGPALSGWGAVVAKYPDGTPAIVEGTSGQGWVILLGVHPEAPESWLRGMEFSTPASVANAYAGSLVNAALARAQLPHY